MFKAVEISTENFEISTDVLYATIANRWRHLMNLKKTGKTRTNSKGDKEELVN